jgi:hypothetical protein
MRENAVKVLTKDDAASLLNAAELDSFIRKLSRQLQTSGASYAMSPDAQAKTALAKFLAYLLLKQAPVCVYLTSWGLRQYGEQLDLLYGYRRSAGETRTLSQAPVHVFDSTASEALVSVLCMVFYFSLEAWIFDLEGRTLIRINRDGRLEMQTEGEEDIRNFAGNPGKYLAPLLGR